MRLKLSSLTALIPLGLLSACNMNSTSAVERAQQNLAEVRAESAKNIQEAEAELAKVIAETSTKLESARRDLPASPSLERPDGTMSGTTEPAPTPAN